MTCTPSSSAPRPCSIGELFEPMVDRPRATVRGTSFAVSLPSNEHDIWAVVEVIRLSERLASCRRPAADGCSARRLWRRSPPSAPGFRSSRRATASPCRSGLVRAASYAALRARARLPPKHPCGYWRYRPPRQPQRCACLRLQQWIQRQKAMSYGAKLRAMWPTLAQLRGVYLDAEAIAAGAKDSQYYTDEMLVAARPRSDRRGRRDAQRVVSVHVGGGAVRCARFPRDAYFIDEPKVYLVTRQEAQRDFNAADRLASCARTTRPTLGGAARRWSRARSSGAGSSWPTCTPTRSSRASTPRGSGGRWRDHHRTRGWARCSCARRGCTCGRGRTTEIMAMSLAPEAELVYRLQWDAYFSPTTGARSSRRRRTSRPSCRSCASCAGGGRPRWLRHRLRRLARLAGSRPTSAQSASPPRRACRSRPTPHPMAPSRRPSPPVVLASQRRPRDLGPHLRQIAPAWSGCRPETRRRHADQERRDAQAPPLQHARLRLRPPAAAAAGASTGHAAAATAPSTRGCARRHLDTGDAPDDELGGGGGARRTWRAMRCRGLIRQPVGGEGLPRSPSAPTPARARARAARVVDALLAHGAPSGAADGEMASLLAGARRGSIASLAAANPPPRSRAPDARRRHGMSPPPIAATPARWARAAARRGGDGRRRTRDRRGRSRGGRMCLARAARAAAGRHPAAWRGHRRRQRRRRLHRRRAAGAPPPRAAAGRQAAERPEWAARAARYWAGGAEPPQPRARVTAAADLGAVSGAATRRRARGRRRAAGCVRTSRRRRARPAAERGRGWRLSAQGQQGATPSRRPPNSPPPPPPRRGAAPHRPAQPRLADESDPRCHQLPPTTARAPTVAVADRPSPEGGGAAASRPTTLPRWAAPSRRPSAGTPRARRHPRTSRRRRGGGRTAARELPLDESMAEHLAEAGGRAQGSTQARRGGGRRAARPMLEALELDGGRRRCTRSSRRWARAGWRPARGGGCRASWRAPSSGRPTTPRRAAGAAPQLSRSGRGAR